MAKKLFVSFSGDDVRFVRELFRALSGPDVQIWDYSNPDDAVPVGSHLGEHLTERIRASDYFLIVVSPAALDSKRGDWVSRELTVALEERLDARQALIPIVLGDTDKANWPTPFARLRDLAYVEVLPDSRASLDRLTSTLFVRLGVTMPARQPIVPRFPLAERLADELRPLRLSVAAFNGLMRQAALAEDAYGRAHFERAIVHLDSIGATFPEDSDDLYYTGIAKGLCELELGRLELAELSFRAASKSLHADENVHGGLGLILLRQRRFRDAVERFKTAQAVSPDDQSARFNLLLARHLSGERIDPVPPFDIAEFQGSLRQNAARLWAGLYRVLGQLDQAERVLGLVDRDEADEETLRFQALLRTEQGAHRDAVDLLKRRMPQDASLETWHMLARALLHFDIESGLQIFRTVLCSDRTHRQYLIEMARIVLRQRGRLAAAAICRGMLDDPTLPLPSNPSDFYWDGFANHLSGRAERAKHDFERSRGFGAPYEEILKADQRG